MNKLNLNAYYYSFEPTGNEQIDSVLAAVAAAGKSFHNTDQWSESFEWLNDGDSAEKMIQIAADNAARAINK